MKNLLTVLMLLCLPVVLLSCASAPHETSTEKLSHSFTDMSDGLPQEGLWRESLALYDLNGDGFLDIIAPPPRKPKEGWKRPFIFLREAGEKKWREGEYKFPQGYSYGSIAAGDLNGDGFPDVALAQHGGNIVLFLYDKVKGFVESPLPVKEEFHSRAVVLSDINGDGRLDLIAASEGPFSRDYKIRGVLAAINKGDKEWEMSIPQESHGLYGDSVAAGDFNGDGSKDIAVAFLTTSREMQKLIWFGDGKGVYKSYSANLFGEDTALPMIVRTGDIDGNGGEEIAFGLALTGGGEKEKGRISILKWTGEGFSDISTGLNNLGYIVALDVADIDGDGLGELVVLTDSGIHICKYNSTSGWTEQLRYPVPADNVSNVTDLRAGRNRDGSVVIVYNLGRYDAAGRSQGIKAYIMDSVSQSSK